MFMSGCLTHLRAGRGPRGVRDRSRRDCAPALPPHAERSNALSGRRPCRPMVPVRGSCAAPAAQHSPAMTGAGHHMSFTILGLIMLCSGIEAALWGSDLGLWGPSRLRQLAYEYGGFWPGLLAGWKPNYPGQAAAMFVTYALLHGGPGHLAANMITLWALGREVVAQVGTGRFLAVYAASALGGAAA